jgi:aminocarboxymuconate-semialdehyde decarboxylase
MKELNFAGSQIGSHVNQWNLSDENLFPFFRKAEELGAALFVHPWDMVGQERMSKYWLPWLVGMPAVGALAIASMIFGGVFERLPGLRVAFAHGGGAFPGTIGRLEHGFQARPDLCAIDNDKPPISYAGKFWVDSLVHDPRTLRYVIEILGEDKIALGTDYPFPLGELKAGEMIEAMEDLSAGTREKLLWRNAIDWLGVPPANHGLPEGDARKDALASSTRTGDKK